MTETAVGPSKGTEIDIVQLVFLLVEERAIFLSLFWF